MTGVSYPPYIPATGWASYADTQYTTGSPLALTSDVATVMPNNAGAVIETQLPYDVASFYSGGKIRSKDGDGILITIDFIGRPSTATETSLDVWLDIGSPVGEFYRTTMTFPKGNGVNRHFAIAIGPYSGATWAANGATVYCQSDAPLSIFGVRYVVQRLHKA